MDYRALVDRQIAEIREAVGTNLAINALSGGVDSSVVTVLAHRALGPQLKTVFIDNALMREGEPQRVIETFADMCIPVQLIDAREEFLDALRGLTDPEEKREAITRTFYRNVFGRLVREIGAKCLLHGTILTDIEETVAGIKRQHNILAQLGIDPEKEYGYKVLEPLKELRKDGVREVAKLLGLPAAVARRMPFPGPALACADRGRSHGPAPGDRARGHHDRRRGTGRQRGLPIPGGALGGACDGHPQRKARVRRDHRGPRDPQRRRSRGYRRGVALAATTPAVRADHGDWGRESLPLRLDPQAAGNRRVRVASSPSPSGRGSG